MDGALRFAVGSPARGGADVRLELADDAVVWAHAAVLRERVPFFARMLDSGMRETEPGTDGVCRVRLRDTDPAAALLALRQAYRMVWYAEWDELLEVHEVLDAWGMEAERRQCAARIVAAPVSARQIPVAMAWIAGGHPVSDALLRALQQAMPRSEHPFGREDDDDAAAAWLAVPADAAERYLRRPDLNAKERDVLAAARRWALADGRTAEERRRVVRCVRVALLSLEDLAAMRADGLLSDADACDAYRTFSTVRLNMHGRAIDPGLDYLPRCRARLYVDPTDAETALLRRPRRYPCRCAGHDVCVLWALPYVAVPPTGNCLWSHTVRICDEEGMRLSFECRDKHTMRMSLRAVNNAKRYRIASLEFGPCQTTTDRAEAIWPDLGPHAEANGHVIRCMVHLVAVGAS